MTTITEDRFDQIEQIANDYLTANADALYDGTIQLTSSPP
jgi:hypothetical protein